MMSSTPCTICGGSKAEHENSIHAYSEKWGDLATPEQRRQGQQQPMMVKLPGAQTNEAGAIGRLVEVLLEKGLLNTGEALYVAGMGEKPAAQSGYQDPATVVEVRR
jgi:hypothetical protein